MLKLDKTILDIKTNYKGCLLMNTIRKLKSVMETLSYLRESCDPVIYTLNVSDIYHNIDGAFDMMMEFSKYLSDNKYYKGSLLRDTELNGYMNDCFMVYVKEDDIPVSMILYRERFEEKDVELIMIYTRKEYQGKGYGKYLVNYIKNKFMKPMIWGVHYNNLTAIKFYRGLGAESNHQYISSEYPFIIFKY